MNRSRALQEFAGIHRVSSASSSVIVVLVGEEYAGYNPLNRAQTDLALLISLLLSVAGLNAYSRSCWKKGRTIHQIDLRNGETKIGWLEKRVRKLRRTRDDVRFST